MRSAALQVGALGGLPAMAMGPADAAAPPLVVLPGLAPEHAVPTGPLRWPELALMRPFAARRRVIWLARRPGLAPDATVADVAADVARALTAAPAVAGAVDVLGISTGGSIALQLALDHPRRVRRLVVVSAAARLGDAARAHQRRVAARARAGARRRAHALLLADLAPPRSLRAVAAAAVGYAAGPRLYPSAGDLADLAAMVAAEDGFDVLDRLGELHAPTLVVAGGRDRSYAPELFERTAAAIPRGRLLRYPRRGHVTVAADSRFAAAVIRFLDGAVLDRWPMAPPIQDDGSRPGE